MKTERKTFNPARVKTYTFVGIFNDKIWVKNLER